MWTELLENAVKIESIFKDEVPQLNEVVIKVVEFNYNGPTAKVVVDLNHYPEKPPKKWLLNGYNKVSMTLQLVGLHSVNITKWSTSNVCSIEIEKKSGSEKYVSITGDCNLKIRCSWINIEQISGYIDTV